MRHWRRIRSRDRERLDEYASEGGVHAFSLGSSDRLVPGSGPCYSVRVEKRASSLWRGSQTSEFCGPLTRWRIQRPAIGDFRVTSSDDVRRMILRNKLLGRWAAEKLGLTGQDAEAYSDALARGTRDPERRDVFSKIRKDFDAAGVAQSDEQILRVMHA